MLRPRCLVSFAGLCLVISLGLNCDARAVNVSNTWTMPQEGLNVFYRFFRDRISWFEADAVCQFHHANLVTVDNSFQFDATRDLLRELDVNDIVWIGLMRPQNSDRFMWSNSRPLVADTGYWAESLPLMDAPLCAVIDPIRDYRWHALRCGGPETASFLCEMPVPSWADACILKDMPNLTMQYMADTASIELIRNCQEEGLLRHTCKGKEDRERAIGQLICPKERLEAQRITDITNSHFKSLQIIKNIRTDNNENNDIDLLPNYGSRMAINIQVAPPVPRVSSVPGLGELMQSDAPGTVSMSGLYRIPDQVPKPVKKSAKKVIVPDFAKKLQSHQQHQQQQQQQQLKTRKTQARQQEQEQQEKEQREQKEHKEEMMMGDQPALSEEQLPPGMAFGMGLPLNEDEDSNSDVSNEIFEHLPHKKKILPQDLRTMSPIFEVKATATTAKATVATVSTTEAPTTTVKTTAAAVITTTKEVSTSTEAPATTPKLPAATTTTAPATTTTTTAPMTTPTKEQVTTTVKAEPSTTTTATTTSTVKPKKATTTTTTEKPEQSTTTEKLQQSTTTAEKLHQSTTTSEKPQQPATTSEKPHQSSTTSEKPHQSPTTTPTTAATSPITTTVAAATSTTTATPTLATTTAGIAVTSSGNMAHPIHPSQQHHQQQQQQQQQQFELQQQHATHVNESADNTRFIPPMLLVKSHYVPPSKHASEHATEHATIATTPAAAAATTTVKQAEAEPSTVTSSKGVTAAASEATAQPATAATSSVTATTGTTAATTVDGAKTSVKVAEETAATPPATAAAAATAAPKPATAAAATAAEANQIKSKATTTAVPEKLAPKKEDELETPLEDGEPPEEEAATTRHNFLEETEAPFKPNRRRSLTKPETVSYFKKILG